MISVVNKVDPDQTLQMNRHKFLYFLIPRLLSAYYQRVLEVFASLPTGVGTWLLSFTGDGCVYVGGVEDCC